MPSIIRTILLIAVTLSSAENACAVDWPECFSDLKPAASTVPIKMPEFVYEPYLKAGKMRGEAVLPVRSVKPLGSCAAAAFFESRTVPKWHVESRDANSINLRFAKDLPPYRWFDFDVVTTETLRLRVTVNTGDGDCNDGLWGEVWNRDNGETVATINSTGDCETTYTVTEKYRKLYVRAENWLPCLPSAEDAECFYYQGDYAHRFQLEKIIHLAVVVGLDGKR